MSITDDFSIEARNKKVSLLYLVALSGVLLKRENNVWAGNCPFHKDDANLLSERIRVR